MQKNNISDKIGKITKLLLHIARACMLNSVYGFELCQHIQKKKRKQKYVIDIISSITLKLFAKLDNPYNILKDSINVSEN